VKDLTSFLILAYLLFIAGRAIWYRFRIRTILSKHLGDPPTLADIQNSLTEINATSPTFTFTADRHAKIHFRGRNIFVAFGRVGSVGIGQAGPSWQTSKALFAIAGAEQTSWMAANTDVFTPAFIGPNASIYWTRIAKL